MKYTNQLLPLLIIVSILSSCRKDEVKTTPLTSLIIVNAVVSGKAVKLGSYAATVNNNASAKMALIAGENNLYIWPVGDSLKPYYSTTKLSTSDREIYSLFLCGDTLAPQAILVKESIPYRNDSTAGIRFINLAPNLPNLNITLAATPDVNEVAGLTFKNYTEFKSYAGLEASTYSFQVRDAANPTTVLTTFTLTAAKVPRFANITLVIHQSGASGVGVYSVNNDR
jgi:hypothetical protein